MTDKSSLPALGDVWRYPFLWSREALQGETEGRKSRPCAVALLIGNADGKPEVLLVPVTSQPSSSHPFAVEVPEMEKKRAGLDLHLRLWVICNEFNADLPMDSYYFEPGAKIGSFSPPFIKTLQATMIDAIKARNAQRVKRR